MNLVLVLVVLFALFMITTQTQEEDSMIEIIDNSNRHVAEATSLENAIGALRTLVPEEECDLRAVDLDGTVLAVGFYDNGNDLRIVTIQGIQRTRVEPRPWSGMPTRLDERD